METLASEDIITGYCLKNDCLDPDDCEFCIWHDQLAESHDELLVLFETADYAKNNDVFGKILDVVFADN